MSEKGAGASSGEQILIPGAAGQIGFPLASHLALTNEVWGLGWAARHGTSGQPSGLMWQEG